jgi:hypothetical protein
MRGKIEYERGTSGREWQTMTIVNWWVNCGVHLYIYHAHRIVILWCWYYRLDKDSFRLIRWDKSPLTNDFVIAMWFWKGYGNVFLRNPYDICWWAQYVYGMIWLWFSKTNDYYVTIIYERCCTPSFGTPIFISKIIKAYYDGILFSKNYHASWKLFIKRFHLLHKELSRLYLTPFYSSLSALWS